MRKADVPLLLLLAALGVAVLGGLLAPGGALADRRPWSLDRALFAGRGGKEALERRLGG